MSGSGGRSRRPSPVAPDGPASVAANRQELAASRIRAKAQNAQLSENPDRFPRFHARDGWYFERQPDGGVRIIAPIGEIVLDAETWASVAASVTLAGEHGETFRLMRWAHWAMPSSWALQKRRLDELVGR